MQSQPDAWTAPAHDPADAGAPELPRQRRISSRPFGIGQSRPGTKCQRVDVSPPKLGGPSRKDTGAALEYAHRYPPLNKVVVTDRTRSPRRGAPTRSSGRFLATSPWLTMPPRRCPSITGSRRTLYCAIVRSASSTESSAPIVTGLPSMTHRPDLGGILPVGDAPSHDVSIRQHPQSRSSSPQIGSEPTSRSASCAQPRRESRSHRCLGVASHDFPCGGHAIPFETDACLPSMWIPT